MSDPLPFLNTDAAWTVIIAGLVALWYATKRLTANDKARRREWLRRWDEVRAAATPHLRAMLALPGEGGQARAQRMLAAYDGPVRRMLRNTEDPVAVGFFREHYRKELRRMVARERGEDRKAYAARQESAIKAVMHGYADEDVPLYAFREYLEASPRWDRIFAVTILAFFVIFLLHGALWGICGRWGPRDDDFCTEPREDPR